ncbi:MAG: class I SAM-dependent methyltransferase, partial [Planctomycetota bacterium]
AALHRINLEFYERHAAAFSATREGSWPGWRKVAELVEKGREGAGGDLSVLDLGCGNGRLARFLEEHWQTRFGYLGIDASGLLLELAAGRVGDRGRRFLRHDLLLDGLPSGLVGEPFDLIAVFGLMHHLPGFENRRELLRQAGRLLARGGLLAVSFWLFGDRERFRRRTVTWDGYNRAAAERIDTSDLEPGDLLLAWGEEGAGEAGAAAVRYCCWTPPAQVDRLLDGLELESVAAYSADGAGGDLNLYRLLRRSDG